MVKGWAKLAAEVAPRVAPILGLVREAAVLDPTLRELEDELDSDRLRRMRANARFLADAGHLRPGVSLPQATDVLFAVSSQEMYDLLVVRRGWTTRRYSNFVATTLETHCCEPDHSRIRVPAPRLNVTEKVTAARRSVPTSGTASGLSTHRPH